MKCLVGGCIAKQCQDLDGRWHLVFTVYPYTVCYSITLGMSHSAFPVQALLIFFPLSSLIFRVSVAHNHFCFSTTPFVLPWALISPSLLFGGQPPVHCLADFGCCRVKEAMEWLSGFACVGKLALNKYSLS